MPGNIRHSASAPSKGTATKGRPQGTGSKLDQKHGPIDAAEGFLGIPRSVAEGFEGTRSVYTTTGWSGIIPLTRE